MEQFLRDKISEASFEQLQFEENEQKKIINSNHLEEKQKIDDLRNRIAQAQRKLKVMESP